MKWKQNNKYWASAGFISELLWQSYGPQEDPETAQCSLATHPVHHGVLVRGERGQGVAVVRLTEKLQHGLSPGLLTSSAHCACTRFRPELENKKTVFMTNITATQDCLSRATPPRRVGTSLSRRSPTWAACPSWAASRCPPSRCWSQSNRLKNGMLSQNCLYSVMPTMW